MSYLQKIILLVIAFSCLVACSQTQYKYVRPLDRNFGQKCISQCMVGKYSCEKLCVLKNPSCEIRAQNAAAYDYAEYQQQQRALGRAPTKQLKNFLKDDKCRHACHCTQAYNTCYTACGGQVSPL